MTPVAAPQAFRGHGPPAASASSDYDPVFAGVLFVQTVLGPYLMLIRAMGFSGVGAVWKVLTPLLVLWVLMGVIAAPRRFTLHGGALFFLGLAVYGVLLGVWMQSGDLGGTYGMRQWVSHLFVAGMAVIAFIYFSAVDLDRPGNLRILTFYCYLNAFNFFLVLVLVNTVIRVEYLGLSVSGILLSLGFAVARRDWALGLVSVFVIIMSGKRGVVLAFPMMLVGFWLIQTRSVATFLRGLWVAVLALLGLALTGGIGALLLPDVAEGVLSKFSLLGRIDLDALEIFGVEFLNSFPAAVATSGRSRELYAAYSLLDGKEAWLTGLGYGFGFELLSTGLDYALWNHYTHITPVNFVLQYGLILGVAAMAALLYALVRGSFAVRPGDTGAFTILMTGWGFWAMAWTSYGAGSNIFVWMLFGLVWGGFQRARTRAVAETWA